MLRDLSCWWMEACLSTCSEQGRDRPKFYACRLFYHHIVAYLDLLGYLARYQPSRPGIYMPVISSLLEWKVLLRR